MKQILMSLIISKCPHNHGEKVAVERAKFLASLAASMAPFTVALVCYQHHPWTMTIDFLNLSPQIHTDTGHEKQREN